MGGGKISMVAHPYLALHSLYLPYKGAAGLDTRFIRTFFGPAPSGFTAMNWWIATRFKQTKPMDSDAVLELRHAKPVTMVVGQYPRFSRIGSSPDQYASVRRMSWPMLEPSRPSSLKNVPNTMNVTANLHENDNVKYTA